ncbi:helix-turn-helix domain-containing protein [Hymenobacter sp. BT175]|uniref:helix-turn-helix domain-containing protein n=1 Tax=Hymenobacter translucens TaxID=2886507 RepID=UPI001D0EF060|nr:helix-turn-helix domain-containing protein [Hymenobacter translucens]MCC2547738.1 helix-turn-helix domain-containing protein [Hymenobacter translucens]
MKLPVGAGCRIARELGISKQAVSKVLNGKFRNPAVIARAAELANEYAERRRAQAYRQYINSLSDEALIELMK